MSQVTKYLLMLSMLFGTAALSEKLTPVENDKVCMVNDRHFGVVQIPVKLDGKTYYGCCAACKDRISKTRSLRYSKDPVTGEEVDKALAFIAAKKDGSVHYFKSKKSYTSYKPK